MNKLAVPTQSMQETFPDECRAVDNNESKDEVVIVGDEDRTTPLAEAENIPASKLVHQNSQGYADRGIKRRSGVELEVAGTRTRHFRDSRAQPEDFLSPRSQTDGGMAQAVRELSGGKRT